MDAPLRYGLLMGSGGVLLLMIAPQPAGAILLWSVVGVQAAIGALLVWSRMRLPYATAALALDASAAAVLAYVYSRGQTMFGEPMGWAALGVLLLSGVLLAVVEPRANPGKWQKWRVHLRETSLRGLLLGRHIPTVRS